MLSSHWFHFSIQCQHKHGAPAGHLRTFTGDFWTHKSFNRSLAAEVTTNTVNKGKFHVCDRPRTEAEEQKSTRPSVMQRKQSRRLQVPLPIRRVQCRENNLQDAIQKSKDRNKHPLVLDSPVKLCFNKKQYFKKQFYPSFHMPAGQFPVKEMVLRVGSTSVNVLLYNAYCVIVL